MARRKQFGDQHVRDLKVKKDQPYFLHADPLSPGYLFVRVMRSGVKSYVTVARNASGRQVWHTIERCDRMTIAEARIESANIVARIKQGLTPEEQAPDTLAVVAENWLARVGKGQREIAEKERRIRKHLLPALGSYVLTEIKKSHVSALLDKVEDKHGARTADMVRTDLLSIATWQSGRIDDYTPPFRGMPKRSQSAARERVLDRTELALVWNAAADAGRFGAIIKLLLLTGQRREKVLTMRWSDVDLTSGQWTIPKQSGDAKQKGAPDELVLPPVALDLIKAQVRLASSPWIFPAYRGDGHITGVGELKKDFDTKLPADMPNWTLHDLRRSARTYMAEADVPFHVAEKILGHALAGVAGTYDRSKMALQMTAALATLAGYIERVINPQPNVIQIPAVPAHA
jgi:integrase